MRHLAYCMVFALLTVPAVAEEHERKPRLQLLEMFDAPEAVQAVAVDDRAFYAIANSAIGKYDKKTGEKIGSWQATDELPLKHLNSGVVIEGKLYCANSNFPKYPNVSSVEIFAADSLQHLGNHSFGIYQGSLTVVDWHDDAWWCVFAHYSEKVNNDPRALPHSYTTLVKFDPEWRRLEGWVFPQEALDRLAPHSCSGGGWATDGKFYCTGHDRGEVYQLELPAAGSELRLLKTIKLPITGQGIALDRLEPGIVYGIDRPKKQVLKCRLGENDAS